MCGKVKGVKSGAEVKASLNRARVIHIRPETGRASHEQAEVWVKLDGGPNHLELQVHWMTCGKE